MSLGSAFIAATERAILVNPKNDSAVVLFDKTALDLPTTLLTLLPADTYVVIGSEVAWLGFPSVAPSTLCFFSGNISAAFEDGYLIDGVAINGVSGGPVFFIDSGDNNLKVVGAITEYRPNIAAGPTLPGLSFAQSVAHFHSMISNIKSIDEAQQKQREQAKQAAEAATGQPVSPPGESNPVVPPKPLLKPPRKYNR